MQNMSDEGQKSSPEMQNISPDYFLVDIVGALKDASDLEWAQCIPGLDLGRDTQGRGAYMRLHRSHLPLFPGLVEKARELDHRALAEWHRTSLTHWAKFLRPYQLEAVRFARTRASSIIADDLGLGKTVTAIAAADPPVLVCCPLSVLDTWANELRDWRPDWQVHIIRNIKDWQEVDEGFWRRFQVLVVPYSQHRQLPYLSLGGLVGPPHTLILDEAHVLTNQRVQFGQSIRMIGAGRIIGLTATPMRNGLESLHGLLDIVAQRAFGGRNDFLTRYMGATAHPYALGAVLPKEPTNQDELGQRLGEIIIARSRASVDAVVPAHHREIVYINIDLGGLAHVISQLDAPQSKGAQVLQVQNAVRQYLGAKKARWFLGHIAEHFTSRMVVWCWHKEVLRILEEGLRQRAGAPPVDVLQGATPTKKRSEVLAEWNDEERRDEPRILLATIAAAGVGVSLKNCDQAVFVELDWSPVQTMQAEKRHHRFGNVHEHVFTNYLLACHQGEPMAIDADIIEALCRKVDAHTELLGPSSQDEQIKGITASPYVKQTDQELMLQLVRTVEQRMER